jgi:hypothetical protein
MQTGIKDGKVTLIMTYEEWIEMSDIINYTLNHPTPLQRGAQRDQICKDILEETTKLDGAFNEMVQKELTKVPGYLKMAIREANETITPVIPLHKEKIK